MGKKENKKLSFRFVPTQRVIENSKKIGKKLKRLKNTIMNSFQAKIWLKRMEKSENKKLSFRFVSTRWVIENFKKIAKKFKKLKNTIMTSFHAKIGRKSLRKGEKSWYKLSFRFVPTRRVIENIKKIQKYHYGFISSQNRLE